MRCRTVLVPLVVSTAVLSGCQSTEPPEGPTALVASWPAGAIVDLTHPYDGQTIFWPTADPFVLHVVADGITEGGYYYAANTFTTAEHGGTHVDAPRHFAAGQWTVDEIPVEQFVGPAVVVDVTAMAAADRDYQVGVDDLEAWEAVHGAMPPGAIVLLRTGFADRWPDASQYLGTAARGEAAVADLHFPGLDPDAARWLVSERDIDAVGIDTASIDTGQSSTFESHRVLFAANVPAFENLAALDRLPQSGAVVVALPMKISGGSGAPLRAVALLPGA